MENKNVDTVYKAELNFVDEFNPSRNGMILENSYFSVQMLIRIPER